MTELGRERPAVTVLARVAAWVSLPLHVAVGLVPYGGSGLVTPRWATLLLWSSWAVLLAAWAVLHRPRPWLAAAVPFVAVAWWLGVVTAGSLLGGWTA